MKPVVRLSSILLVAAAVAASDSPLLRGSGRGGGGRGETLRIPIPTDGASDGADDGSGSTPASCPAINKSDNANCGDSNLTVAECKADGGCCVKDNNKYHCVQQQGEEKLALMS